MSGKRIWIFNLILGGLLVWGTLQVRESWAAFDDTHQKGQISTQLIAAETPRASGAVQPVPVAPSDFADIGARDPFSVDRNDTDVVEVAPPPVSTPKPVLFGTLLLGKERLALMGKAGSRSGQPVKVGEDVDGWKIVEIEDKTVVVAANGSRESLVVGRVPIVRSSERTASAVVDSAPDSVQRTVPAPAAASSKTPASGTYTPATYSRIPAVLPPGTHIVDTPFGPKVEQLPK